MRDLCVPISFQRKPSSSSSFAFLKDGPFAVAPPSVNSLIEERATLTQAAGLRPLWEGYRAVYGAGDRKGAGNFKRTSNDVRTTRGAGAFYGWLVQFTRPNTIVEIGTAFGISGMYWLSGVEANGFGTLYTFDPNEDWRELALQNLNAIGTRFVSTLGTFEEAYIDVIPADARVDLAFIDAIHTSAFVNAQFEILRGRSRSGSVIVLDDIRFSTDMYDCWTKLAQANGCLASFEVGSRVGVLEIS